MNHLFQQRHQPWNEPCTDFKQLLHQEKDGSAQQRHQPWNEPSTDFKQLLHQEKDGSAGLCISPANTGLTGMQGNTTTKSQCQNYISCMLSSYDC